jgi:hypothetical protein
MAFVDPLTAFLGLAESASWLDKDRC